MAAFNTIDGSHISGISHNFDDMLKRKNATATVRTYTAIENYETRYKAHIVVAAEGLECHFIFSTKSDTISEAQRIAFAKNMTVACMEHA